MPDPTAPDPLKTLGAAQPGPRQLADAAGREDEGPSPQRLRPGRELLRSPWFLGFGAAWLISIAYVLTTDRSVLPLSEQEPWWYVAGEIWAIVTVAALFRLSRGTPPVDHRWGPTFHRPGAETIGLLIWTVLVLVVGYQFDIRTHIAFVGLGDEAQAIWDQQDITSTLVWCAFNFFALAVVPYVVFRYALGYSRASMLLTFPRPRVWVPFFVLVGVSSYLPVVTEGYFTTPVVAHLLTLVLFTLGSFLPIMILTQSLLAPRLALLTRSWVAGAVLSGLVYAGLNITDAFLAWESPAQAALSLAWAVQVAFWGVVKGVTTLRSGSAWLHIATTHTIHLSEAPAVATTFGLR